MTAVPNPERRFLDPDQKRFAEMSGDTNPMHMDALAARRTQAGAPVAHGVHVVLWVLDQLAHAGHLGGLAGITVSMNRFIYLDRPVTYRITRRTATSIAVDISEDRVVVVTLLLKLGPYGAAAGQDSFVTLPPAAMDRVVETPEALTGAEGWISPPPMAEALGPSFPALTELIGEERVTGLALLSTLVGMECPGLHSIFTAFHAELMDGIPDRPGIGYRVRIADPRFRVVRMAVGGGGLTATVTAFVRMPPMAPPAMAALKDLIVPGEFADHRVLIVGGSRGLGALSARMIALGGGKLVLTYARGAKDAEDVVSDIGHEVRDAVSAVIPLDVTQDLAAQLKPISGPFSGLLYFATPQIRRQKAATYVPALHAEFFHCYVTAFAGLTALLLARDPGTPLGVFYPSSVAVTARPDDMTEYAMAKAAGEILAADLMIGEPRLRVVIDRLPRLPTDQNATVVQADFEDPVATMLPLLRWTLAAPKGG